MVHSRFSPNTTNFTVMQNGQLVPAFLCPSDDHKVAVLNAVGVVLSIVSDFVGEAFFETKWLTHIVLAIPVFRVVKLKITFHQKLALCGVFAVGTLVAAIEVVRGALVLASGNSIESVPTNIIMITLQCTLAIVVANLPILRPLLFKRSFSGSTGSTTHRTRSHSGPSWMSRSTYAKGSIPLHDYAGHTQVTVGGPGVGTPFYNNGIMKSVEVRVESQSFISSAESSRNGSKSYEPV
jgi:hypothetical protein